jgi:hypothetical protein
MAEQLGMTLRWGSGGSMNELTARPSTSRLAMPPEASARRVASAMYQGVSCRACFSYSVWP